MNKIQQLTDANGNNIYPIAYAQGGMKMDLLWTNPNPTSNFSGGTITFSDGDYDMYIFETNYATSSELKVHNISIGHSNFLLIFFERTALYQREVTFTNGSVTFANTKVASYNAGSWSTANNVLIPYKIYGLKMSYIVPTSVHGMQYIEV